MYGDGDAETAALRAQEVPLLWQLAKPPLPEPRSDDDGEDGAADRRRSSAGEEAGGGGGLSRSGSSRGSTRRGSNGDGDGSGIAVSPGAALALEAMRSTAKGVHAGPLMGKLLRLLHDTGAEDVEELQNLVRVRDPATGQSLLQWATLHHHFLLVEWLVKRLKRYAFAFSPSSPEMIIYEKWQEMLPELRATLQRDAARTAEEVLQANSSFQPLLEQGKAVLSAMEDHQARSGAGGGRHRNGDEDDDDDDDDYDGENARGMRGGPRNGEDNDNDDEDDEDENAEPEPTADDIVYEELADYHDEWGPRGKGLVRQVRELGVYEGARRGHQVPMLVSAGGGAGSVITAVGGSSGADDVDDAPADPLEAARLRQSQRLLNYTKEGLGQTLFFNGDCYCGVYRAGARDGWGTYLWSTPGVIYTGEWRHNQRHGHGRIVYPDGGKYLGAWVDDRKHGSGRYTYADGSTYQGSWVNGVRHGYGRHVFRDGSQFIGTFTDGAFTTGEWRLAGGDTRYVGHFVDDVPDGPGLFLFRCNSGVHSARSRAGVDRLQAQAKGRGDAETALTTLAPAAFQSTLTSFAAQGVVIQEGYYANGVWHPGVICDTSAAPQLLVVAQKRRKVPLRMAPSYAGGTLQDLVLVANFQPFREWLRQLPTASEGGADVVSLSVTSVRFRTDAVHSGTTAATPHARRVEEVRLQVVRQDSEGHRIIVTGGGGLNTSSNEEVVLTEPVTRLLVVLDGGSAGAEGPLVLLERVANLAVVPRDGTVSGTAGVHQLRLPSTSRSAAGALRGDFTEVVAPALRLTVTARTTLSFMMPQATGVEAGNCSSNATEEVLLYAQQLHPTSLAAVHEKLRALPGADGTRYIAVPATEVVKCSSDAVTVVAVAQWLRKRQTHRLPLATIAPQRAPTPNLPQPEPRPPLEPLIAERARLRRRQEQRLRHAMESDGRGAGAGRHGGGAAGDSDQDDE